MCRFELFPKSDIMVFKVPLSGFILSWKKKKNMPASWEKKLYLFWWSYIYIYIYLKQSSKLIFFEKFECIKSSIGVYSALYFLIFGGELYLWSIGCLLFPNVQTFTFPKMIVGFDDLPAVLGRLCNLGRINWWTTMGECSFQVNFFFATFIVRVVLFWHLIIWNCSFCDVSAFNQSNLKV